MADIDDKVHAELSPSGASRWMRCPGSVVLERGRPDNSNQHSRWGTSAHYIADLCLQPYAGGTASEPLNAESFVGRVLQVEGFDIEVDMEMADCVNTYLNHVQAYVDIATGDTLFPEQRLDISFLTGEEGAAGTSDAIGITRNGRELIVIDLKGGRGVKVDADTEQLHMYGSAALREYELLYPIEEVLLVIIQPRLNHVSEHRLTVEDLREWEAEAELAAQQVRLADAANNQQLTIPLTPGEKQCRFCKAKSICPALRGEVEASIVRTASAATADDFADLSLPKKVAAVADKETMQQLDTDALGEAMRAAPLVEIWLKEVRAEVERRLQDGQPVAGFKLVEGRLGNRAWRDESEVETALKAARLKSDEMYSKKVISPTQAEKLLKDKPKTWAKIAPLIGDREKGKPSVAPENDPRPAWTPAAAVDDFAEIEPFFDETIVETSPMIVREVEALTVAAYIELPSDSTGVEVAEAFASLSVEDDPLFG